MSKSLFRHDLNGLESIQSGGCVGRLHYLILISLICIHLGRALLSALRILSAGVGQRLSGAFLVSTFRSDGNCVGELFASVTEYLFEYVVLL